MSSMIDVVFLLLIYFIVTHKDELSEAHLAVNLPTPGAAASDRKPQFLEIEVRPNEVYLQGARLPLDTVRQKLNVVAQYDPEQTVMIKTSLQARARELVSVLDMCKEAGLENLNVLTLED